MEPGRKPVFKAVSSGFLLWGLKTPALIRPAFRVFWTLLSKEQGNESRSAAG
ncbi:hypothetical protein FIV00_20545 [Labrenzia sp. THAF82]|nr:hypothetical protein FIV00_20545 [Labrenzia sp. THAF82]